MKKFLKPLKGIAIFVAGIFIGGMMFSDGDSSSDNSQSITNEKPVVAEAKTETQKTETKKVETPVAKPVEKQPVQLFSNDKVTIFYKEVTSEGVKLLVENKTNVTITIQADSIAVNGFSSNDITMSDDISPKSKGYAMVQTAELSDAGEPKTLSGGLRVIDFNGGFDDIAVNFNNIAIQ